MIYILQWYLFNDRIVTKVTEQAVKTCEAYLLFYVKKHHETQKEEVKRVVEQVTQAENSLVTTWKENNDTADNATALNDDATKVTSANTSTVPNTILLSMTSTNHTANAAIDTQSIRYISRHWIQKLQILHRMEPLDNRDLCCPHGIPYLLPKVY